MKFGVFYELQCPRPWEADTELKLYQNALSQVELADKLGYHYAWEVEHHFLEEYSHSPQPEVFLAAASQRTKQIRLGHGIIQLTTNHPARVAEKVACLDLVSNGRVEFGMGEGASITELGPFGREMENKQAVWEDGVRCVLPMFKDGGWEYDGPYFKFPLRNVLPKPIQKPHPPLWVACSQLETIEMAGRCGIGALGFQFLSAEMANAWVHAYYNSFVLRQKKLADYQANCNIAMVSYFMCAETDEEARRRADGATFFQFSLAWYSGARNRERAAPGQQHHAEKRHCGEFHEGPPGSFDRLLVSRPSGFKADVFCQRCFRMFAPTSPAIIANLMDNVVKAATPATCCVRNHKLSGWRLPRSSDDLAIQAKRCRARLDHQVLY